MVKEKKEKAMKSDEEARVQLNVAADIHYFYVLFTRELIPGSIQSQLLEPKTKFLTNSQPRSFCLVFCHCAASSSIISFSNDRNSLNYMLPKIGSSHFKQYFPSVRNLTILSLPLLYLSSFLIRLRPSIAVAILANSGHLSIFMTP